MKGNKRSTRLTKTQIILIVVATFALGFVMSVRKADAICVDERIEYPGCSMDQIRSSEAPTKLMTARHYDTQTWGQSKSVWDGFGGGPSEDKVQKAYYDLVQRYKEQHNEWPDNRTWNALKENTDCGGDMGVYTSPVNAFCTFNHNLAWVADHTSYLVFGCDSEAVAGFGGASGVAIAMNTAKLAVLKAGAWGFAGAAAGCVSGGLYNDIKSGVGAAIGGIFDKHPTNKRLGIGPGGR